MAKKSVSKLKKELDRVYSIYIRNKYADSDGYCTCVTCGVKKHWKELHNGHFVSRTHNSTRWDDRNCHPQCPRCNLFCEGAKPSYAVFLERMYGQGIIQKLDAKGRELFSVDTLFLEEQIAKYKEIIK